jgi:methylglutaconyl-CoA hydratase
MSDLIAVERREGGVAWVVLNRPEARNALSRQVCRELGELALSLGEDREVRSVVITGAGDKAFCAGADLKERKGVSADEAGPYLDAISGAANAWAAIPKPTIAAMNGSAFGGGLELALACDFRVAVPGALFALTEVRLGIMPGAGGTQRLPRLVGVARAKEIILLGRRVSAPRALDIGLVHELAEPGDLETATMALCEELSRCAPLSVTMSKRAIDRGIDLPIDEGLSLERACYDVTLFTEDRDEGLRAFAEKRAPRFQGR